MTTPGGDPATTGTRLVQVTLPHAVFGLVAAGGVVIDAAPIAGWAIGEPEKKVADYYRRRGAAFQVV